MTKWPQRHKFKLMAAIFVCFIGLFVLGATSLSNRLERLSSPSTISQVLSRNFNVTTKSIGKIDIVGFGNPHLNIDNIVLSHPHWGEATIKQITIYPQLRSLLRGIINLESIVLKHPKFMISQERIDNFSFSDFTTSQTAASRLLLDPLNAPSSISYHLRPHDGETVLKRNKAGEISTEIIIENGEFEFSEYKSEQASIFDPIFKSISQQFLIDLTYSNAFGLTPEIKSIFKPKQAITETNIHKFQDAPWYFNISTAHHSDGQSDLVLSLNGPVLDLSFQGRTSQNPGFEPKGELKIDVNEIDQIASFFDLPVETFPFQNSFELDSQIEINRHIIKLSNSAVTLDQDKGIGRFTLLFGKERPELQGTLAIDQIDLERIFDLVTNSTRANMPWLIDTDIRFSAGDVTFDPYSLGASAGIVKTKENSFELNFNSSSLFSGSGNLLFKQNVEFGEEIYILEGNLSKIDYPKMLDGISYRTNLTGSGFLKFALRSNYFSWPLDLQHFTGSIDGLIEGGSISILKFDNPQLDEEPKQVAELFNDEKFNFQQFEFMASFGPDSIEIPKIKLITEDLIISGAASSSIITKKVKGEGFLRMEDIVEDKINVTLVPVNLHGDWDQIKITPLNEE